MVNLLPTAIDGVVTTDLKRVGDERGSFGEMFRREWFAETDWTRTQSNHSESAAGVLRGLHYHFHQVDYWYVVRGVVRAGLFDMRPSSPTFKTATTVVLDASAPRGLFIPIGVAHGFYAVTDCTLLYFVNNYYDGKDEYGVAWDDSEVGVDWQVSAPPRLSGRDQNNPRYSEIAPDKLPR